jgi:SAM-dependent methyltransferase
MKTDTAHLAWDQRWATPERHNEWATPEPDVRAVAERLAREAPDGARPRVLDLGCGIGRHALLFARLGFHTAATDLAEAGLGELRRIADAEGLSIEAHVAPMTKLPFPDGCFDHVLSFNVIYHGDGQVVRAAIAEIRRVLRPGGTYQGTMLSKRNAGYGLGTAVAPDTYVREEDMAEHDADKVHPHFYCNARDLIGLFEGFELLRLEDQRHEKPGSWHWHMLAERL